MRSSADPIKFVLYQNAFTNTAKANVNNPDPDNTKKLIFYGVKMVNTEPKTEYIFRDEAIRQFQFAETLWTLIGTLTPAEFMNTFPIMKDFDGHKCECKDYFYTRDFIRTLPPGEPIGDIEAVMNFLWEYHNWETRVFTIKVLSYMDNLLRLEGQPSAWESFCDEKGIKTYSKYTDEKGREFMVDRETGKIFRVNKPLPRYLRAVK